MPLGLLAVRLGDAQNPAAVVSRGRADAADEAVRRQVRMCGAGSIDKPGFHQRLDRRERHSLRNGERRERHHQLSQCVRQRRQVRQQELDKRRDKFLTSLNM